MIITKIEYQKNNKEKVNIFIDDKFSFSATVDFYAEHSFLLKKGQMITVSILEKLKNEAQPENAFSKLCHLIQYSQNTEQMMRKKLKSIGFNEEAINYAIKKAIKTNLINDNNFLESIIEYAKSKEYGINRIKNRMIKKGIPINDDSLYIITKNISNKKFEEFAYKKAIKKLKSLKTKKIEDKIILKNKIYAYLQTQGFLYEEIKNTLYKIEKEI